MRGRTAKTGAGRQGVRAGRRGSRSWETKGWDLADSGWEKIDAMVGDWRMGGGRWETVAWKMGESTYTMSTPFYMTVEGFLNKWSLFFHFVLFCVFCSTMHTDFRTCVCLPSTSLACQLKILPPPPHKALFRIIWLLKCK